MPADIWQPLEGEVEGVQAIPRRSAVSVLISVRRALMSGKRASMMYGVRGVQCTCSRKPMPLT